MPRRVRKEVSLGPAGLEPPAGARIRRKATVKIQKKTTDSSIDTNRKLKSERVLKSKGGRRMCHFLKPFFKKNAGTQPKNEL